MVSCWSSMRRTPHWSAATGKPVQPGFQAQSAPAGFHDIQAEVGSWCRGGGVAEAFGVSSEVDVHVGTLSKALGCQGGFVACSKRMKRLLLSRGRSYIFSTSLAAPMVAAAIAALRAGEEVHPTACHVMLSYHVRNSMAAVTLTQDGCHRVSGYNTDMGGVGAGEAAASLDAGEAAGGGAGCGCPQPHCCFGDGQRVGCRGSVSGPAWQRLLRACDPASHCAPRHLQVGMRRHTPCILPSVAWQLNLARICLST